jgi:hypothetical protein
MYPVKNKLRDYGTMKNFMVLGSLIRGMELDEIPSESNAMPFPRKDTVMMIYDGHPLSGKRRVPNLSLGPKTCCGWGT